MPLDDTESGGSVRDELIAAFTAKKDDATQGAEPKAPGSEADKGVETPEKAAQASNADKDSKPAADQAGDKPIDPPARWTKEEKEQFAELDPKAQRILAARNKSVEADYTRKMQEISQERTRFKAIDEIIAPRREEWTRAGLSDDAALKMVFSYWDFAGRDPRGFIEMFAQQRGIDLASLYAPKIDPAALAQPQIGADGQPITPVVHPVVAQLLEDQSKQIAALQAQLGQTHQLVQSRESLSRQEAQSTAAAELAAFSSATDEHGNPRYPFFEDVKADMAAMFAIHQGMSPQEIEQRRKLTLSDAYDRAVYMRPDIRSKVLENEWLARERAERTKRSEEAARAKKAGLSVSSSSSGLPAPAAADGGKPRSLREELEAQFAAARNASRV